jgi:hypothetical protein
MTEDNMLEKINAIRHALAEARTIAEVKDIRDKAEALRVYFSQREGGEEMMHVGAEWKLRAERRLGQLLIDSPDYGRGKKSLTGSDFGFKDHNLPTLCQQIARVPEEVFERHLEDVKASGSVITTAAAARLARRAQAAANGKPVAPPPVSGDLWRVEQADCLDWFAAQPADSLDLVFGSPPYEDARSYLEDGEDPGVARTTEDWVAWMVQVYQAALRCCTGLVAFVVAGRTKNYAWTASPALLMAALVKEGVTLRCPAFYKRVGIPGSGGPDWLRNDCEFIVCATRGGPLPWSDNTAMGRPPAYGPGGEISHRQQDGRCVNDPVGYASSSERANQGPHRARTQAGRVYHPPAIANPGNVIDCGAVGGGNMGDRLCHVNEAPFPEAIAEFFVRSFCPPRWHRVRPVQRLGHDGRDGRAPRAAIPGL